MAKSIGNITNFALGIADSNKMGVAGQCRFTRGFDFRSDPAQMTVNPRASLISGTVVKDLPMWFERVGSNLWSYGNQGRIYKTVDTVVTQEHIAADSQGNGMAYLGEDKTLYYAQDTTIGRYGRVDQTPQFQDDYLSSIGGEPTNTRSLSLVRASSQYASVADTAEQSITGNISLQAYFKPTTLPEDLEEQVLISKWDEASDQRSYKLSINPTSASFGDGSDGALTISSNTTETVIDANFSAVAGVNSFTISNVTGTFVAGQKVLLIQSRGTNTGQAEIRTILSVVSTTVTLTENITGTYSHSATTSVAEKAQIRVIPQYTDATINNGITYTAKAWNGLKGGILYFFANNSIVNNGTIYVAGKGYSQNGFHNPVNGIGIYTFSSGRSGGQGEGSGGFGQYQTSESAGGNPNANGNGGGAGTDFQNAGGAGGGYGATGSNNTVNTAFGGTSIGDANLTGLFFGGQGGGAGTGGGHAEQYGGKGGFGGGIFGFRTPTFTNNGTINISGLNGDGGITTDGSGGGGGAGGSCVGYFIDGTLGTIIASGGTGGTVPNGRNGGAGAVGRIAFYYLTSITGSTTPTATQNEDDSLAVSNGHELRFSISSTGANEERYFIDISSLISTSLWTRWSVAWQASTSTANFYAGATSLGSMTRSLTAIYNSTAPFTVGADFDTTAQNFADGLFDDVRLWNKTLSASEVAYSNNRVLTGSESGLVSYYEYETDLTDSGTAADDLTGSGSPTYNIDIPFSGVTTRKDQDQINDQDSQVYATTTAINEGATHRQSFVPNKDPQKSIVINVSDKGDSADWTLTVHDPQNIVVAEKTVTNANLNTGFFEFIFDEVWRPIRGATYHFHITTTNTTGAPAVVTGTVSDLETAYFTSHYQFLVDDKYHPTTQFLNFIAIGNERYVAKLEAGDIYDPHKLVLPSGYRVRAFGFWREFLAIGTWIGDSITDNDLGRIFFWDGIGDTFNFYIDVPEGGINAIKGSRGDLYFIAGYSGNQMVYKGGDKADKIKVIPKYERGDIFEVHPGGMSMWKAILMFGTGERQSDNIEGGIYSWGSLNLTIPESLNMEHPTSLGVQTDVEIGGVTASGSSLYYGWKLGNSYGIDRVAIDASPYTNVATYETLISDLGSTSKEKLPSTYRVDFKPLLTGESVSIKYRRNRNDNFITMATEDEVGATFVRSTINIESREIELGFDVVCDATSPTIIGHGLENEDGRTTTAI